MTHTKELGSCPPASSITIAACALGKKRPSPPHATPTPQPEQAVEGRHQAPGWCTDWRGEFILLPAANPHSFLPVFRNSGFCLSPDSLSWGEPRPLLSQVTKEEAEGREEKGLLTRLHCK